MNAVTIDVEKPASLIDNSINIPEDKLKDSLETDQSSAPRFRDERWKNGTWDLNMFVRNGRMDWDGVIVAGELYLLASIVPFTYFIADIFLLVF